MIDYQYEEMMMELCNDPDYISLCEKKEQEVREAINRLTDAEIAEIFGVIK